MNKLTRFYIISAIALFIAFSIGCSSNLTAPTTGQVTNLALDRDKKTTKKKTSSGKTKTKTKTEVETEIDFTYTVDGKNYTGYVEKDGDVMKDFAVGSPAAVCYNPKNPEESDIFVNGTKCG